MAAAGRKGRSPRLGSVGRCLSNHDTLPPLSAIVLESLTRSYGARRGIDAINLSVPEGSLYGFLGPNGAGKSTTIRVVMALLRPTAGRAFAFGMDCWSRAPQIKAAIGYLPGDLRLYPWLTGESALRWVGAVRGVALATPGKSLADRLSLDLRTRVRDMSRGTRQKLGIVLALAHNPRLLILDEPTSGLDPLVQAEFRTLLKERCAEGTTVFFSSHTLGEVEQLCDRIAIVREGRLVADATLRELRERAGLEVTVRFKHPHAAAETPPVFLSVTARSDRSWKATYLGEPDTLTRWLAAHELEDVSIGRPDLETLFHRYYAPTP